MIGFFLKAYTMCSEEFIESECSHMVEASEQIECRTGTLLRHRKKAEVVWRGSSLASKGEKEYAVVPYSKGTEPITRFF